MKTNRSILLVAWIFFGLQLYSQCLFDDGQINRPTKIKWINGDIYLAATNSEFDTSTTVYATFSRFDSQGNRIWSVEFDSASVITDFIETDDNAILLIGHTPFIPDSNNGFFLNNRSIIAKISLNGTLIFCRTYENTERESFNSIVRHPNPGTGNSPYYILGFERLSFSLEDVVTLYNVDNAGVLVWKKTYVYAGFFDDEYSRKLIVHGNGNLIMMGAANEITPRGHVVEVNTNGNIVSDYNQTTHFSSIADGLSLSGNEKLFVGRGLSQTSCIAKYSSGNAQRWALSFPNQIDLLEVRRSSNGTIYTLGIGIIGGVEVPVITSITDNGTSATVNWMRHFNDGSINNLSRVAANFDIQSNGDIVYTDGRSSSQYGQGQEDILLEITDLNLNSCLSRSIAINATPITAPITDWNTTIQSSTLPASLNYGNVQNWVPQKSCICENCQAQFNITPSPTGCFTYNFTSTSTGIITGYLWSFGVGFSQSNEQNPTFTYPGPGTYTVCLYITNGQCDSTVCQTLVVPEPIECPTFSQSPFNSSTPGIDYCFGLNFASPPTGIATYTITVDGVNVVGPTSNIVGGFCHSFPAAGSYEICYTATTTTECTYQCCQTIEVLAEGGTFDCMHGDAQSNVPTKVKWIDGDIYIAATNSATSGNTNTRATFSRYNGQGSLVWSIELDSASVITDFVATEDNAILLVGRTPIISAGGSLFINNQSILAKISLNGTLLFNRSFNNTGRETFTTIIRHPNPGVTNSPYYILGFENDDPASFNTFDRVMLLNVNNQGAVNWKKQYRNSFDDEYARKLILLNNGNLLMAGSGDNSGADGYLLEVNTSGVIINGWAQISYFASIADGFTMQNGDLILAGRSKTPSAGIAKYDAQKSLRWGLNFPSQIDLLAVDYDVNGHIYALGIQTIGTLQTPVITRITDNGSSATVDWMRHLNDGTLSNTARVASTFDVLTTGDIVYAEGRDGDLYGLGLEDLFLAVTGPNFGTCFVESINPLAFNAVTPGLTGFTPQILDPSIPSVVNYGSATAWLPQDHCECDNCQALFSFSPSASVCFEYNFNNTSVGHNLNFNWSFGDGTFSNIQNPSHIFPGQGSYNVCLTVSSGACENTICHIIEIDYDFECPVINSQYQATGANGSIKYEFTLMQSTPSVISSNWVTIDGSIIIPAQSGPITQFTNLFPGVGTYTVCYYATTSNGCVIECCQEIEVRDRNNTFDCLHGDDRSNVPTKVKWIDGSIYIATTNSALTGSTETYATFSRYDDNGNWMWSIELDSASLITDFVATEDDAILLVGRTPIVSTGSGFFIDNQSLLAKISTNGVLLYSRTYNNTGRETFNSIVRHPNPGMNNSPYYILGFENDNINSFNTYDRVMLYNLNTSGAVNWKLQYSNGFDDEYGRKLILLNNGNLLMMGSGHANDPDGYFVEVDPNGIIIRDEAQTTYFESIADGFSLPNNELVLAGRMQGATSGVARYDAQNNVRWGLRFTGQIEMLAADHDKQGNIYTLGIQTINGIESPIITRITDNGSSATVVWQKHLNDGTMMNTNRVAATFDILDSGNIVYAEGRDGNQYAFMKEDLLLAVTGPDFGTCFIKTQVPPVFSSISPLISEFATDTIVTIVPDSVDYCLALAWTPQDSCVCICDASFTFGSSTNGCFEYQFTNTSTGHNINYLWNFGDGNTSTEKNPVHTFSAPGSYNVCLTVANATCEHTYCLVINVSPPNMSIQCNDDLIVSTSSGSCSALITLPQPIVIAASCLEVVVSCTRSDAQPFNAPYLPGATIITCTATDQFGNAVSCSFSITVTDTEPPSISCPENICQFIPSGQNSTIVNFSPPVANDNCNVNTSCTPISGSSFPLGQTTVICTAFDTAGNMATCSFIVEIKTDTSSLCCINEEAFNEQFAAGFSLQRNECQVQLQALALNNCQQVVIEWGDGQQNGPVSGTTTLSHTYSGSGDYTICATVSEFGDNEEPCFSKDTCMTICIVCDTCNTTVWDKEFPAAGWDIFSDLTIGANGEIYVIGTVSSSGMLIDGIQVSSVDSQGDVVLAKMNPNGTVSGGHLYTFGGNGGIGDRGETIKIAPNGDIVIGGRVAGSNINLAYNGIGSGASVSSGLLSVSQEYNFIARYNANFELLWFDTIRGDKIMDIAIHKTNQMVAVGSRYTDFAPSLRQNYIVNYSASTGLNTWTKVWEHTFGADGYNDNTWSVETDEFGGIFVCGEFTGETTLGTITLGYPDNIISGYVANLDTNGIVNWAFDIPKLFAPAINQGGVAFALDIEYPYLFVIGNGSNTLDPTGITSPPTFIDSSGGIYVAKYRIDTNPTLNSSNLQWAFNIPRVGNDFNDIKLDGMGNLLITGQLINANIDLDPNTAVNTNAIFNASGADQDFFIAKYTDLYNGVILPTFVCGIQVSSSKPDVSYGMDVYDGHIFIAGALNHDPFPNFVQANPYLGKFDCPCDAEPLACCEDISISEQVIPTDSTNCCYGFDMLNTTGFDIHKVEVSLLETNDWEIDAGNVMLTAGFILNGSSTTQLNIEHSTGILPKGTSAEFLSLCLKKINNQAVIPQTLVFKWYETIPGGESQLACTDTIEINCNITVGTTALPVNDFRLYPNPSTGVINIEFEEVLQKDHRIRLLDVTGTEIAIDMLQEGQSRFSLDFGTLPSGMYLLEVTNPNGKAAYKKLVINH